MLEYRRCSACDQEFPLNPENFPPYTAKGKRYLRSLCRECWRKNRREYQARPESKKLKQESRKRRDPAKVAAEKKRSHERCRDKDNARVREWCAKNREHQRAVAKRNYEANKPERIKRAMLNTQKRMARKRALPDTLTDTEWQHALDYFSKDGVVCCAVCGNPVGLFHTIAMDHWIPLTSPDCPGGGADNIIPLCHGDYGCNNSKNNRDPHEWLLSKYSAKKAAEIEAAIQRYFDTIAK